MAYLANGTAGMQYEARWCEGCVHYEGCPVMSLHKLWNYDQHPEDECGDIKTRALALLIPMEPVQMPNGTLVDFPGKCRMFYEENP